MTLTLSGVDLGALARSRARFSPTGRLSTWPHLNSPWSPGEAKRWMSERRTQVAPAAIDVYVRELLAFSAGSGARTTSISKTLSKLLISCSISAVAQRCPQFVNVCSQKARPHCQCSSHMGWLVQPDPSTNSSLMSLIASAPNMTWR
jgi:hypothetical protein